MINRLLGRKATESADTPELESAPAPPGVRSEPTDRRDNPLTLDDNSDNATRRQLVQMMMRDGLRKHGIPPGWVDCRILMVNSRSRGQGLYLILVMRHWDMLLLTYAHAFQQQLLAAITEFEPQASVWLHGVSWELDVGDSCPYQDMPDASIWLDLLAPDIPVPAPREAVAAPVADAPIADAPVSEEEAEVLRDLERMFAIRDANIREQGSPDTAPVDFQNTETSQRS
ncbi:MAG: hypothetical protein H0W47_03290 [Polaromonas sp.]|nr:hypothetical protein [Polaromonas sp.]